MTSSQLLSIQAELMQREPLFHQPQFSATRSEFDQMMDADFWEVGASGRRYSRQFVLDTLSNRERQPEEDTWRTEGFLCRQLGPDTFLLTYTLHQGERITRRSTLWRRTSAGWKALYHQGTIVLEC